MRFIAVLGTLFILSSCSDSDMEYECGGGTDFKINKDKNLAEMSHHDETIFFYLSRIYVDNSIIYYEFKDQSSFNIKNRIWMPDNFLSAELIYDGNYYECSKK